MKSRIAVVFIVGICALATACSQTPEQTPSTTVISTSRAPVTAPAPPASPTPGISVAPAAPGVNGADGSTGNDLSPQYCAQNEDPGCPVGTYVGPDAIPNPNGDGSYVPCEGTICTNPDYGAGPDPEQVDPGGPVDDIPEPGQDMESP